jgi:acetylornithine deacetylase/succinyl-diaminopimelate desuccinylase-like protein
MRFDVIASGQRGHSGAPGAGTDLTEKLLFARGGVQEIIRGHLTLSSPDGWQSQVKVPFIQVGTPGVYNITPDRAVMGVEVRPIPQDDLAGLTQELQAYCETHGLLLEIRVKENGVICDSANPFLQALIRSVEACSKSKARIGRKLPGTSARFAPQGQGVVWGQSGLGPHARDERHYIPSILPYYQALCQFGANLREISAGT